MSTPNPLGMPDPTTGMPSFPEYREEVTRAAEQKAAGAQQIVSTAETAGQQQIARAEQFAGSQQPFTENAPTDQINAVMGPAPLLFALTAIGGKATSVNGLAMLGALNGMSDGLIKGDQEALKQHWDRYNAAFDKWKANADQQFRIYQELATAYAGATDGKLRALTAAMNMTNDATQMKLQVDDPATYWTLKAKMEEAHAKLIEARTKAAAAGAFGGDPRIGQLQAALAERGVSLPVGLRSKEQQISLYRGLLARNPDKNVDEIADLVKSGAIEFGAEKKETQTAATVAGRVAVAANEIKQFAPLIRQASAAVPRGQFVPINRLLQAGEASISDPNLKKLRIAVNSLLNAYDLLAARGGTDKDKRAAAHALITAADSPEALQAGLQQFMLEAEAAGRAAAEAMKPSGAPKSVSFYELP